MARKVLVRGRNPKALIFFNSRMVIGVRDEMPYYSTARVPRAQGSSASSFR